jgi:Fic family protein
MQPQTKLSWEQIEKVLGNPCKLRILRVLVKNPQKPLTQHLLAKHTHLNPREVKKHLEYLIKLNWVEKTPYKPFKYRINKQDEDVKRLVEFLSPYI